MNGGPDDMISYFMPVDAIDVTILPPNASTPGVDAFLDSQHSQPFHFHHHAV
ncbi:MAG: hypothetical protein ACYCUV_00115 [Phycisphaerae bacterium]